jgi:hypothetical protein
MGSLQAAEMAELLSIEDGISWHLKFNHYPPVPSSMIQPCLDAIEACLDEDYERLIHLNGSSWRGNDSAPAYAVVEGHHLQSWIELDEEYEDED